MKNFATILIASCFPLLLLSQNDTVPVFQLKDSDYVRVLDNFIADAKADMLFGNGLNALIETPLNDEDALTKGFLRCGFDEEAKGGWVIRAAKYMDLWDTFRAVLYEYNLELFVALYKKEKEDEYYFRIWKTNICRKIDLSSPLKSWQTLLSALLTSRSEYVFQIVTPTGMKSLITPVSPCQEKDPFGVQFRQWGKMWSDNKVAMKQVNSSTVILKTSNPDHHPEFRFILTEIGWKMDEVIWP